LQIGKEDVDAPCSNSRMQHQIPTEDCFCCSVGIKVRGGEERITPCKSDNTSVIFGRRVAWLISEEKKVERSKILEIYCFL
jgi:hypothetical protein